MSDKVKDKIIELINNEYNTKSGPWFNSDYKNIKAISIDQRGRVGEHFIKSVFEKHGYLVDYVNNDHGDYDITVEGVNIEVKLATLSLSSGVFQHEGIKKSGEWDMVVFVDISPSATYVTFLTQKDFDFRTEPAKVTVGSKTKNIHFRGKDDRSQKATGAGYKVDFKYNLLEEVVETIEVVERFNEAKKKVV